MVFARKAFGIDFVDVFSTGGSRRKPSSRRLYFQTTDRRAIPGSGGHHCLDGIARKFLRFDGIRRQSGKNRFLVGVRRRIDALIHRSAELLRQALVQLTGIFAFDGCDFGCQQAQ